ncbi:MAG: toxin-antitoxin system HicB family antitoxin [Aridibacter sp.]
MNKYQFNLVWSNRDNEYMVTCPEFPGLSAFGETAEEALAEAQVALELFVETYQEDGVPLPEPLTVPEYSGQLRLRLPKSLHGQSAKFAADDEISLNQFICNAVQAKVTGEQVSQQLISEMRKEIAISAIRNVILWRKDTKFNERWARIEFEGIRSDTKEYSN